jgi:hypothetical protein
MDDPWGSPWAADTQQNGAPPLSGLEPPPRAFLTSNGPPVPTIATSSPWALDDGGFGEWASAEPASTKSVSASSGWHGWSNGDGATPGQLAPAPKDEEFAGASPISWPGNAATQVAVSPGVKALTRSRSSSQFRQPSPDPWAAGFDLSPVPGPKPERKRSSPRLNAKSEEDYTSGRDGAASAEERSRRGTGTTLAVPTNPWEDDQLWNTVADAEESVEGESEEEPKPDLSKKEERENKRPSTSSSDQSRQDERPQDSPMTSSDEDPRPRPPIQQRTVSSKVQVLVDMFDGLSKQPEVELVERETVTRSVEKVANQEDVNVAVEAGYGGSDETQSSASGEPAATPRPRAQTPTSMADLSHKGDTTPAPEQRSPPGTKTMPSNLQVLTEKFGPIHFEIDAVTAAAALFPELEPSRAFTEPDLYVPDSLQMDSFTEISERKSWYRISRQGTMRKHNAGDDDNYRRVGWADSTVRVDTLKIVRRWMEEESTGLRLPIGGGAGKGNMFGWDSAAEPVTLEEVFRRKRQPSEPKTTTQHAISPPIPPALLGMQSVAKSMSEMSHLATLHTTSVANNVGDDDDDDWGEMVASPQTGGLESLAGNTVPPAFGMKEPPKPLTMETAPTTTQKRELPFQNSIRPSVPVGNQVDLPANQPRTDTIDANPPAANHKTPATTGKAAELQQTKDDIRSSQAARRIIEGLPDLSYMLR